MQWIPVDSTAKAAQLASKEKHTATICSKIAAQIYNLPIMFQNFEGHKDDANVQALFKKRGAELKWLGSYIREL
ncbi:prephenate dehydratase domain-containing protein [Helicobacter enhydrae]|uniref:prephenate dehydratase domain-containing protein n=1 Tax=Helicobacter enhydrae TaxID=222136 RepID=UPI0009FD7E60|nr:prephenate dehydratase domain-containing protein [Helicobacter enhydrae]